MSAAQILPLPHREHALLICNLRRKEQSLDMQLAHLARTQPVQNERSQQEFIRLRGELLSIHHQLAEALNKGAHP